MAINTRRGLISALELAGVDVAQRAPPVSDSIQLTYMVSDLSPLVAPFTVPTFGFTELSPAELITRGVIEIRPPADSALRVIWFRNDDDTNGFFVAVLAATRIVASLATFEADISIGAETRATLEDGTGGSGAEGMLFPGGAQTPDGWPDLIIPPGSILAFISSANNLGVRASLLWQELPIVAPSTPA